MSPILFLWTQDSPFLGWKWELSSTFSHKMLQQPKCCSSQKSYTQNVSSLRNTCDTKWKYCVCILGLWNVKVILQKRLIWKENWQNWQNLKLFWIINAKFVEHSVKYHRKNHNFNSFEPFQLLLQFGSFCEISGYASENRIFVSEETSTTF